MDFLWLIWHVPVGGLFWVDAGPTSVLLGRRRAIGGHVFSATWDIFMTDHYGGIAYCFLWICALCTHISMFCFICSLTIILCIIKTVQPTPLVVSEPGRYISQSHEKCIKDVLLTFPCIYQIHGTSNGLMHSWCPSYYLNHTRLSFSKTQIPIPHITFLLILTFTHSDMFFDFSTKTAISVCASVCFVVRWFRLFHLNQTVFLYFDC